MENSVESGQKEQGLVLALSLPDDDPSGVKDKLFNEVALTELNSDDGYTKFTTFLDGLFKKDDLSDMYEKLTDFIRYRQGDNQDMEKFIL